MPIFSAILSVEEYENVAEIRPAEGRVWPLRVSCGACRETGKSYVYVDAAEMVEVDGGGTHNTAFRCRTCKAQICISIVDDSTRPLTCAGSSDDGEGGAGGPASGPVVSFDVRGGEPEELQLGDQWDVVATSGEVFRAVDISQDCCEYDEKAGATVSFLNAAVDFEKATNKKR